MDFLTNVIPEVFGALAAQSLISYIIVRIIDRIKYKDKVRKPDSFRQSLISGVVIGSCIFLFMYSYLFANNPSIYDSNLLIDIFIGSRFLSFILRIFITILSAFVVYFLTIRKINKLAREVFYKNLVDEIWADDMLFKSYFVMLSNKDSVIDSISDGQEDLDYFKTALAVYLITYRNSKKIDMDIPEFRKDVHGKVVGYGKMLFKNPFATFSIIILLIFLGFVFQSMFIRICCFVIIPFVSYLVSTIKLELFIGSLRQYVLSLQ